MAKEKASQVPFACSRALLGNCACAVSRCQERELEAANARVKALEEQQKKLSKTVQTNQAAAEKQKQTTAEAGAKVCGMPLWTVLLARRRRCAIVYCTRRLRLWIAKFCPCGGSSR